MRMHAHERDSERKGKKNSGAKRKLDFRMMTVLNCNHFMDNHLCEWDSRRAHFKLPQFKCNCSLLLFADVGALRLKWWLRTKWNQTIHFITDNWTLWIPYFMHIWNIKWKNMLHSLTENIFDNRRLVWNQPSTLNKYGQRHGH